MTEHTYKRGDRVRIVSDGPLGVTRVHDLYHFVEDVFTETGEPGEIVTPASGMPDGWQLVMLDRRDPSPPEGAVDDRFYVPASPAMIEPLDA